MVLVSSGEEQLQGKETELVCEFVYLCVFCICVFVYLQWCWYPVEEQLHRKAPELVARGRRAPHQSPQPKLLKLSVYSFLLFLQ